MRILQNSIAAMLLLSSSMAYAKVYSEITVRGAASLGQSSVLYYSKLQAGKNISKLDIKNAIINLHKSGLFDNITIQEQANKLVITVQEMPVIGKIKFSGTDHMPRKEFLEALSSQGIEVGKVFSPNKVYQIRPMLEQTLATMGYEKAVIAVNTRHSSKRSVVLEISVQEGNAVEVKEIKIIGNDNVAERSLISEMQLAPHIWSFLSGNNKFSKFAIAKDLQAIERYYNTQGYVQARAILASTKNIGNGIELVIKVSEGKKYSVAGYKLQGFIKHDYSKSLSSMAVDEPYNVIAVERVKSSLEHALGSMGYAFAKVSFKPVLLSNNKVRVEFYANPGKKVQIRRVNFLGQSKTQDEVLRREMQQTEMAQYNYSQIMESERRLRNLAFVKSATCKPIDHSGFVDLDCQVAEMPSANLIASIGYSPQSGMTYKIDLVQKNLVGSGKRLNVNLEKSDVQTSGQISMTQPYIFNTKYSNTWSVDAVKLQNVHSESSKYQSNHVGLSNDFGLPIGDHSYFSIGLGLQNINILSYDKNVTHIQDFVQAHGEHFGVLDLHAAFKYYDYNKTPFPNEGTSRRLLLSSTLPYKQNTVKYYKIDFTNSSYFPLGHELTLNWLTQFGYGKGYNGDIYPFFKNYWAGGEGSVRGFDTSSLGPKDSKDKPMGGNVFLASSVNLYLPQYFGSDMRYGLFVDAGNVFNDSIDLHQMRASVGAVLQWRTPMAPLTFSYGIPVVKKSGDKIQEFAVSMATDF